MKCFLFLSFIILLSSAFECPSDYWSRFRNKCYLSDKSKLYSLHANVDFCESLNATTLSIHSEEENNYIASKFNDYPYWLGIIQVDFDAKTYAWIDGSFYNYSNWELRVGEKSCAGAYIVDGKWRDITNCGDTNHALCQIDLDSPSYKMQSQKNQLRQDLKDDRKTEESRFNETNDRLEKALNRTYSWISNLNSTFEAKLNEKENRLKKSIEKLEDKMNLLNLSMTFMDSDFQLDLKNKDIQVDNINKELARLHLVNTRLKEVLNTQNDLIANLSYTFRAELRNKDIQVDNINKKMAQHRLVDNKLEQASNSQNDLIANMSSDLMRKGMEIKSTNQEMVRLSLIITRLENAIHTQNDLIHRMSLASERKSTKK